MRCHYPNCRAQAEHTPVVLIPTVRIPAGATIASKTHRPTILIGKEVCTVHRNSYAWVDWFNKADWNHMQEAAREYGYRMNDAEKVEVLWKPVGWTPNKRFLEVDRGEKG